MRFGSRSDKSTSPNIWKACAATAIGYSYARWGKKREALELLSQLQESGGAPADLAVAELGLGHREKALAWLEKAYEYHDDDSLLYLKEDPVYDPLRADHGSRVFYAA